MGSVSFWAGGAWSAAKSAKVWNGSSWVNRVVYHWNGSSWVDDSTLVYTYTANLTDSICPGSYPSGKWRTSNDDVYQGVYEQTETYNNIGYAWFDTAEIQADLSGKAIARVEAYIWRQAYGIGGSVYLDVHGHRMPPAMRGNTTVTLAVGASYLFSETENAVLIARSTGAWFDISTNVGNELRDGTAYGWALYATPADYTDDYAICDGYARTNPPKIRITCY